MVYNEDYVIWDIVVEYQHLTEAFIKKYDLKIPDDK